MAKKYVFASLIAAVLFALAAPAASAYQDVSFENIKSFIAEKYNPVADKLPSSAKMLFGNERINIYIDGIALGVVTAGGKATEITEGGLLKPTMKVTTNKETAEEILNSDDPTAALKKAVKERSIKIKGVGMLKWLKYSISNLAIITGNVLGV